MYVLDLYCMYSSQRGCAVLMQKKRKEIYLNHEEAAKHKDHMLDVCCLPYGFSVYVDHALLMVSPYAFLLMVHASVLMLFCVWTYAW